MKDLAMIHHSIQPKFVMLQEAAKTRLGLVIKQTMTVRTAAEQLALYAKGRMSVTEVNVLMNAACMGHVTEADNRIVTKAKTVDDTFHGYGLAFDIAVFSPDGKKIVWTADSDWNSDDQDDWTQVGQLADEFGLEWGGNWTGMPDPPHYQDRKGLTIQKLKAARILSGRCITDSEIILAGGTL